MLWIENLKRLLNGDFERTILEKLSDVDSKFKDVIRTIKEEKKQQSEVPILPIIQYGKNELLASRDDFIADLKQDILFHDEELAAASMNIHSTVKLYEKLLYSAEKAIGNDYAILIYRLAHLDILRETIMKYFLGESDVVSFYLCFKNTQAFRFAWNSVPLVSLSKVFIIQEDDKTPIDKTYYIVVDMTDGDIIIRSTMGTVHFESRYRKTIIRVLYSIYTKKYYLYHLAEMI